MMCLKKGEQKSKLVNVSQGYAYTKFAHTTTRASIMGPFPSKKNRRAEQRAQCTVVV